MAFLNNFASDGVNIVVSAQDEFSTTLKKANKDLEGLGKTATTSSIAIKAGFLAAGAALSKFAIDGFGELAQSQATFNRLTFQFGENAQNIIDISKRLSKTSVATTNDIGQAFAEVNLKLSEFGLNFSHQQKLVKIALDLSAASGRSFEQVMDDLSAGIQGNVKGLKNYGIVLDEDATLQDTFNKIVEVGTSVQGASAKQLETTAGKIATLKESWGDFAESFATLVAPLVNIALGKMTDIATQLSGAHQQDIDSLREELTSLQDAGPWMQGRREWLENQIIILEANAKANVNMSKLVKDQTQIIGANIPTIGA